jgi:hypothetical protein
MANPVLTGWLVACALFTACSVMCGSDTYHAPLAPIPPPTPYRPSYPQCRGLAMDRALCELHEHVAEQK